MVLDFCYRVLTHISRYPLRLLLARRVAIGKEDPSRWPERIGRPSQARPSGPLIWCHAASVGESLSLLALIGRLRDCSPRPTILVTTGTVASARLLNERLPALASHEGLIHQFAPLDRKVWVRRFLDHWRPDLAIWIESELWPNMLSEMHARSVPAVLLNGRMSPRSYQRWIFARSWAKKLLAPFVLVLTQTASEAGRFSDLGAWPVAYLGNLKCAAAPPPANAVACAALSAALGRRLAWVFASTHAGEEEIALAIHRRLEARYPGLLTVIAPRHPRRAEDIKTLLRSRGISFATRSSGELPAPGQQIYLADTMGELGVLYSTIPVAVIGGSFVPVGGHNPIEAAQLGAAIVLGPHMQNFSAISEALLAGQGARQVRNEGELADQLSDLLGAPAQRKRQIEAARMIVQKDAETLDRILDMLAPLLRSVGLRVAEKDSADGSDDNSLPQDYPAQMEG